MVSEDFSASSLGRGVRVLIVSEDSLTRAGLAAVLDGESDIFVVAQMARFSDLHQELDVYQPDVVLWDLGWESPDTPDALSDAQESGVPIVALVSGETQVTKAWTSGVRGLLLRTAEAKTLVEAIRAAGQGLAVFTPELVSALVTPSDEVILPSSSELSPRETQVLHLLAEGLPNKTIAQRLSISEHTVKFHVNAVLGKLGVQSRTEAVIQATRRGLIHL